MFTTGQYIHKKDNQRISKNNSSSVMLVTSCKEIEDNMFLINGNIKAKLNWYEVVTKEQADQIKVSKQYKPIKKFPKAKAPFNVGDYIHKNNWQMFKTLTPVMMINSIKNYQPETNSVYINSCYFELDKITVISAEQAGLIIDKFLNTKVADVILKNSPETTCSRQDNGKKKKKWDKQAALDHVFQQNMLRPDKPMDAYVCPHCNEIHVGKIPSQKTIEIYNQKTASKKANWFKKIYDNIIKLFKK